MKLLVVDDHPVFRDGLAALLKQAADQEAQFRGYVQTVAASGGGGGTADEIAKLADLRDRGVISQEEFDAAKAKALT